MRSAYCRWLQGLNPVHPRPFFFLLELETVSLALEDPFSHPMGAVGLGESKLWFKFWVCILFAM